MDLPRHIPDSLKWATITTRLHILDSLKLLLMRAFGENNQTESVEALPNLCPYRSLKNPVVELWQEEWFDVPVNMATRELIATLVLSIVSFEESKSVKSVISAKYNEHTPLPCSDIESAWCEGRQATADKRTHCSTWRVWRLH